MDSFPEDTKLDPTCELFRRGDPDYKSMSQLSRVWLPGSGLVFGLALHAMTNYFRRRPFRAGVHMYGVYGAAGLVVGEWLYRKTLEITAERDLQYYHYMTLHPEDFRPPRRVLYRDYLESWFPIR